MTAACSAVMTARHTQQVKALCLLRTQLLCQRIARHARHSVGNSSCCLLSLAVLRKLTASSLLVITAVVCSARLSYDRDTPVLSTALEAVKVVPPKTIKTRLGNVHVALLPCPSGRSVPQSCHAHCCNGVQDAKSNHLTLLRAGSGSSGPLTGGQQSAPVSVCRCHPRPPAARYPEAGAKRGTRQTHAPQIV